MSVYYDPMIAKLVVWENDRDRALKSLVYALDQYKVVGPNTNVQFLKDLARHPSFVAGDVDTGFIGVSTAADLFFFRSKTMSKHVILLEAQGIPAEGVKPTFCARHRPGGGAPTPGKCRALQVHFQW